MSKHRTDNDPTGFYMKVDLRIASISEMNDIKVLDAFSGRGRIWKEVQKKHPGNIDITQIDTRIDKEGAYLKGDNSKFMGSINLSQFDLIDLDAYGIPFKQLEVVFKSNFKGIIHCTFIQSGMGMLPKKMLEKVGYSRAMIDKIPTLFSKKGIEILYKYLSINNIERLYLLSLGRKHYLYFKID